MCISLSGFFGNMNDVLYLFSGWLLSIFLLKLYEKYIMLYNYRVVDGVKIIEFWVLLEILEKINSRKKWGVGDLRPLLR